AHGRLRRPLGRAGAPAVPVPGQAGPPGAPGGGGLHGAGPRGAGGAPQALGARAPGRGPRGAVRGPGLRPRRPAAPTGPAGLRARAGRREPLLRRRAGLGGAQRHASKGGERGSGEVVLHVYHFGQSAGVRALNGALLQFGVGGAFHTGVEVHGREWAFGFKDGSGSGVFCTEPGGHADHSHWFALAQGATPLSESEVDALVQRLSKEWVASGFDSFSRNCADFSQELCLGLGVCGPPAWVGRGPRLAGSVLAALAGEGDGEPQAQAGLESEGEALARACLD
ncbi:unnamed protein product, partial [Prorocentrum cordatum]